MPELRWNKTEFLECLGVLPEVDEDETYFDYTVARQGLVLMLTVRPLESVIELRLQREGGHKDLISLAVLVEGEVEFKREKWGCFLRCCDCRILADRLYYLREGGAARSSFGQRIDVELAVDPDIRIFPK